MNITMKSIPQGTVLSAYTAYIEVRSQHSRGSSAHQFGGPDTYVAVQMVPEGVEPMSALIQSAADKRGIIIIQP